MRYFSSSVSHK